MEKFPRRIYSLSSAKYGAETIAVAFAKTSRSPEPFDRIADELDAEKSAQFGEKWIVGYGHSSVAEHAVLHLALENVSRLAIETIEGNRLASYTEKSTRYQQWDAQAFVRPLEMMDFSFGQSYLELMDLLFTTYARALEVLQGWGEANTPRREGEGEKAWKNRARLKSVDVARFLLPASSLANVGMTINARSLEYALKKMLSSPLEEVRQIGREVKRVSAEEIPVLLKYAEPMEYLPALTSDLCAYAEPLPSSGTVTTCRLLGAEEWAEERILASVLYRFSAVNWQDCFDHVLGMDEQDKQSLVERLFAGTNEFDVPLRELEYSTLTFDLLMDQGAYFEFKRHRMMSQTAQTLGTGLGYALPRAICEAGFEGEYCHAMDAVGMLYKQIPHWNMNAASYLVPNGYNRRVLCQLNMRELFHFVRIRTAPNAHFSIRCVARAMWEQAERVYPHFARYMNVKLKQNSSDFQEECFSHLACG